jgi:hypothetical protein
MKLEEYSGLGTTVGMMDSIAFGWSMAVENMTKLSTTNVCTSSSQLNQSPKSAASTGEDDPSLVLFPKPSLDKSSYRQLAGVLSAPQCYGAL